MSRHSTLPPAADPLASASDAASDATVFIRISGPPRREAPRSVQPTPVPPPPTPSRRPIARTLPQTMRRSVAPPPPPPTRRVVPSPMVAPMVAPRKASVHTPFRVAASEQTEVSAPVRTGLHATILLGFTTVCLALVAVSFAAVGPTESRAANPLAAELSPGLADGGAMGDTGDTGHWEDEEEELMEEVGTASPPPPSRPSSEPIRPAPSRPSPGTLAVQLPDPQGVTSIAVSCPSGFSARSSYRQGAHIIANVPAESCTLWFRGSSPYKYVGASGGQTLTCSFRSGLTQCAPS